MSASEKEDDGQGPSSPKKEMRSPSPTPSCVSMKSDLSKDVGVWFKPGESSTEPPKKEMRSHSPTPSCVSMKSNLSKDVDIVFKPGESSTEPPKKEMQSPSPTPSCVSMKSDLSKDVRVGFKPGESSTEPPKKEMRFHSPTPSCVSMKSNLSKDVDIVFKAGESSTEPPKQEKQFHSPTSSCVSIEAPLTVPGGYYKIASALLLRSQKHKSMLREKYQHLTEGITKVENPTLVSKIYTGLRITVGGRGCIHQEHEIRQIESASGIGKTPENLIEFNEIFQPLTIGPLRIRTVLTKGVAGIGKTVYVHKFIQDWADEKTNQDVHYIFPLPFRGLNLLIDRKHSLAELLQLFGFQLDSRIFSNAGCKIVFIFDGLDECRLPLDFSSNLRCDVSEPTSVSELLISLIKGNLLPSAHIWITTRPAAANQIPAKFVDKVTEIRGFTDEQKEEYFRKRISDENLASGAIAHLKLSRSLYIMCYIPVFSWLSATVLERILCDKESVEFPTSLTQMYTHFLIIQTSQKNIKYAERKETDKEMIFKLGRLAFQQLEKDHLIFYEEDLRECGIDVKEASVHSGVCTQIFREESLLSEESVFSFVHLSIQEFLAALYVFLCFSNRESNMPDQQQISQFSALFRAATLSDLYKTAVDLALQKKNGHLDLFLRFLLGLSLESNQNLLRHILQKTSSQSQSSENTVQYIKQRIREDPSALIGTLRSNTGQLVNLFRCLNELNQHAVVEVIKRSPTDYHLTQSDWKMGSLSIFMLLPGQRETRKFVFKTSKEQLVEFDLQNLLKTPEEGYQKKKNLTELLSPDEVLQKLVPVVGSSESAKLCSCNLTWRSCESLASVYSLPQCCLTELDLSNNDIQDAGVQYISNWLQIPHCNLEKLKLWNCNLTWKTCEALAKALGPPSEEHPSTLRELDLSYNDLQDAGVVHLHSWLKALHCKLEKLKLEKCGLREKSCDALGSTFNTSLRELNLSDNQLLNGAVQHLCPWLSSTTCKLEKLQLWSCNLTWRSCEALAKALSSPSEEHPSGLRELDLSYNDLQDAGVKHICSWLQSDYCRLEKLDLWECYITRRGCEDLASALHSGSSVLRELDLSENNLVNDDLQPLRNLLKVPAHSLKKLHWVTDIHLCQDFSTFFESQPPCE